MSVILILAGIAGLAAGIFALPIQLHTVPKPGFFHRVAISAKNTLIGLRSGEYGDKYISLAPALAHICSIRFMRWKDALSITR